MEVHITYANKTPPVDLTIPSVHGWGSPVFEINVEGTSGRARKTSLINYLQEFGFSFRGLCNRADKLISSVELRDILVIDSLVKKPTNVQRTVHGKECEESKYNLVLYDISSDTIQESAYFTRDLEPITDSDKVFEGHKLNTKILSTDMATRVEYKDMTKVLMFSIMTSLSKFLPSYTLQFDSDTSKLHICYKGSEIEDFEDIKSPDEYVLFTLLYSLLTKGKHTGVFYINCNGFSSEVLQALVLFVRLYFINEAAIFLYNVPKTLGADKIKREVITLPNYKINGSEAIQK